MAVQKTKNIMKSPKYKIGDYSYGKLNFAGSRGHALLDELTIGKFCSFATGIEMIVEGYHHNPEWFTTYPMSSDYLKDEWPQTFKNTVPKSKEHHYIRIGNDVWIGKSAKLFSGVTIGDGAIIGTGALVTKDVPPYSIAVGCPIKVIKKRFDDTTIETLLEIKWWDWPKQKIDEFGHIICSGNLEKLKEVANI